ncbi:probable serine/threonine-protein kinase At1g01540 isoform X1 [Zingiber officinale]|uniref:probable serine/threonine-protein kinase At1g01540 isoform X1 n=1 Tax=Zingiber officinale TaxID=94328 RepID=UPI001C4B889B|nr:probable serine/threonine-protein kinase At1g01540 isoform X1 [Zingiber officinale]
MSGFELSRHTPILGLPLWALIGVCIAVAAALLLSLCFVLLRKGESSRTSAVPIAAPKEIQEVRVDSARASEPDPSPPTPIDPQKPHFSPTKERNGAGSPDAAPGVSRLGWGQWFTLQEIMAATGQFSYENVIGEGGYGIVYRGVMQDGTQIAAKNLVNNKGQAETEFMVEVEAIGRVRHKNLVRLLGYCAEGVHRILVYEYIENGNLEKWLHGDVGSRSPLTWEIRMDIMLGVAKGILYLHEGLEPKVVHRDIKSSNILLDKQWTPKLSDFGLAKLLGTGRTHVTTRVMGTFGLVNFYFSRLLISFAKQNLIKNCNLCPLDSYVAPEYASTGMLNEKNDVYSFGILLMEIICGRRPIDYNRPPSEVNIIEWIKIMVSSRKTDEVVDPKMPEKPSPRALKKTLLVALRCVDSDSQQRPTIGHVLHMLQVEDFAYLDERRPGRPGRTNPNSAEQKERFPGKPFTEPSK